jgi:hypothetical protein
MPRRQHKEIPIEPDTNEITFMRLHNEATQCIKAGTLAKIVERLTHPCLHSITDIRAFLILYHDYCTEMTLLKQLEDRFHTSKSVEFDTRERALLHGKVLDVMEMWLVDRPQDFEKAGSEAEDCEFCSRFYEAIAKMLEVPPNSPPNHVHEAVCTIRVQLSIALICHPRTQSVVVCFCIQSPS